MENNAPLPVIEPLIKLVFFLRGGRVKESSSDNSSSFRGTLPSNPLKLPETRKEPVNVRLVCAPVLNSLTSTYFVNGGKV